MKLFDKKGVATLIATLLFQKKPPAIYTISFYILLMLYKITMIVDFQVLLTDSITKDKYDKRFSGTILSRDKMFWSFFRFVDIPSYFKNLGLTALFFILLVHALWISLVAYTILNFRKITNMTTSKKDYRPKILFYFKMMNFYILNFDFFFVVNLNILVLSSFCKVIPSERLVNASNLHLVELLDYRKTETQTEYSYSFTSGINLLARCKTINHSFLIFLSVWTMLGSILIKWVSHKVGQHAPDPSYLISGYGNAILLHKAIFATILIYKSWLLSSINPTHLQVDFFFYLIIGLLTVDLLVINLKHPFFYRFMNRFRAGENICLILVSTLILFVRNFQHPLVQSEYQAVIAISLIVCLLVKINDNFQLYFLRNTFLKISHPKASIQKIFRLTFAGLQYVTFFMEDESIFKQKKEAQKILIHFLSIAKNYDLLSQSSVPERQPEFELEENKPDKKAAYIFKKNFKKEIHKRTMSNGFSSASRALNTPNLQPKFLHAHDPEKEALQRSRNIFKVNEVFSEVNENLSTQKNCENTPPNLLEENSPESPSRRRADKSLTRPPAQDISSGSIHKRNPIKDVELYSLGKRLPPTLMERHLREFSPLTSFPELNQNSLNTVLRLIHNIISDKLFQVMSKNTLDQTSVCELLKLDVLLSADFFGSLPASIARISYIKERIRQNHRQKTKEETKQKKENNTSTPFNLMILEGLISIHLKESLEKTEIVMKKYRTFLNDHRLLKENRLRLFECFNFLHEYTKLKKYISKALSVKLHFLKKLKENKIADFRSIFRSATMFKNAMTEIFQKLKHLDYLSLREFNGVQILTAFVKTFLSQDLTQGPHCLNAVLKQKVQLNYAHFIVDSFQANLQETVVLALSGEKKTFHCLTLVSANIQTYLQYTPEELIGHDAIKVIPEPLKSHHKKLLSASRFTGNLLERKVPLTVVAVDKGGFLKETRMYVRLNPGVSKGLSYLACMDYHEKLKTREGIVLVDDNLRVSYVNRQASKFFEPNTPFYEYNYNFLDIFNDIKVVSDYRLSNHMIPFENLLNDPKINNYCKTYYQLIKGKEFTILDKKKRSRVIVCLLNDIFIYRAEHCLHCIYFKASKALKKNALNNLYTVSPESQFRPLNSRAPSKFGQETSKKGYQFNLQTIESSVVKSPCSSASNSEAESFSSEHSLFSKGEIGQNISKMFSRVTEEIRDEEMVALSKVMDKKFSLAEALLNTGVSAGIHNLLQQSPTPWLERDNPTVRQEKNRILKLNTLQDNTKEMVTKIKDVFEKICNRLDKNKIQLAFERLKIKGKSLKRGKTIQLQSYRDREKTDLDLYHMEKRDYQEDMNKMSFTLRNNTKYNRWNKRVWSLIIVILLTTFGEFGLAYFKIYYKSASFFEIQTKLVCSDQSSWVVWGLANYANFFEIARAVDEKILTNNMFEYFSNQSIDDEVHRTIKIMAKSGYYYTKNLQNIILNTSTSSFFADTNKFSYMDRKVKVQNFTGEKWEEAEMSFLEGLAFTYPKFIELASRNFSEPAPSILENRNLDLVEEFARRNARGDLLAHSLNISYVLRDHFMKVVELNSLITRFGDLTLLALMVLMLLIVALILHNSKRQMTRFYKVLFGLKVSDVVTEFEDFSAKAAVMEQVLVNEEKGKDIKKCFKEDKTTVKETLKGQEMMLKGNISHNQNCSFRMNRLFCKLAALSIVLLSTYSVWSFSKTTNVQIVKNITQISLLVIDLYHAHLMMQTSLISYLLWQDDYNTGGKPPYETFRENADLIKNQYLRTFQDFKDEGLGLYQNQYRATIVQDSLCDLLRKFNQHTFLHCEEGNARFISQNMIISIQTVLAIMEETFTRARALSNNREEIHKLFWDPKFKAYLSYVFGSNLFGDIYYLFEYPALNTLQEYLSPTELLPNGERVHLEHNRDQSVFMKLFSPLLLAYLILCFIIFIQVYVEEMRYYWGTLQLIPLLLIRKNPVLYYAFMKAFRGSHKLVQF